MDEYTVVMALYDFVPVLALLMGSFYLVRISLLVRDRPCRHFFIIGTSLVLLGGLLKATWKLLYAANIADIQWMSEVQFILLAPGFVGLLAAVITLLQQRSAAKAPMLAIAGWKTPLAFDNGAG